LEEKRAFSLDADDVMILKALQEDGRIGYAKISRKNGIPTSTVHDKVKRMLKIGIIKKFTVLLNERSLGIENVAILGVETTAKYYRKVAESLSQINEVAEVYGTTAEFDLMIKVQATSRDELSSILSKVRAIEGVDNIYIYSVLEVFKDEHIIPIIK
jgi:Lrp/AsnC family transcriptional regulator for asnA, asnC and gidA